MISKEGFYVILIVRDFSILGNYFWMVNLFKGVGKL